MRISSDLQYMRELRYSNSGDFFVIAKTCTNHYISIVYKDLLLNSLTWIPDTRLTSLDNYTYVTIELIWL